MIERESFLRVILAEHYGIREATLLPTSGGSESDRSVVIVQQNDARKIMRVYPPENTRSNPAALAQVLNLLAEADFPAERIVTAVNGDSVVSVDGWRVVLTTFIDGTPTDQLDSEFFGFGTTLGRLHALFTPDELLARDVPLAERTLDSEMDMARADLLAVSRPDDARLGAFYDELLAAIDAIDRCHDLPYTLIHNDFQPGNVLRTADGSLSVIDWDGSGRSPAIVDLGYLIGHIHPEGLPRPDAARIHALLDGYLQHHALTESDIERLPDMIRFRPITYLTSDFGEYAAHLDNPDPSYVHCLAIYHSVYEAAAIAREHWERRNARYAEEFIPNPDINAKIEILLYRLTININKIRQLTSAIVHANKTKTTSQPADPIDKVVVTLQESTNGLGKCLEAYDSRLRSCDNDNDFRIWFAALKHDARLPVTALQGTLALAKQLISKSEHPTHYENIKSNIEQLSHVVTSLVKDLW